MSEDRLSRLPPFDNRSYPLRASTRVREGYGMQYELAQACARFIADNEWHDLHPQEVRIRLETELGRLAGPDYVIRISYEVAYDEFIINVNPLYRRFSIRLPNNRSWLYQSASTETLAQNPCFHVAEEDLPDECEL